MDRIISVKDLDTVQRAMSVMPDYISRTAPQRLFQVMNTKPRTAALRRTPLATTRRYTRYVDAKGKTHKVNRTVSGQTGQLRRSIGVEVKGTDVRFGTVNMQNILYAHHIHETANPREGQYWERGMRGFGRGWTTRNTGNKYIEKPLRENSDYIATRFSQLVDDDLKKVGL